MKFYDELSKYYDEIFSYNENTYKFLKDINKKNKKTVLDIACGTGTYLIKLQDDYNHLVGIDLDELMIEKAKHKISNSVNINKEKSLENKELKEKNIVFKYMNMLNIEQLNEKFNLIYCIGNSLVHLNSKDEVRTFLKSVYNMLDEEGIFVFQIINYDRILKKHLDSLPTIDTNNTNFIRNYKYNKNFKDINDIEKIEFNTILKIKNDNKIYENSVALLNLRKDEINKILNEIGFTSIEYFGNFKADPFSEDKSQPLIGVCYK